MMELGNFLSEASGTEKISIICDREGFDSSKNFASSDLSLYKKFF